MNDKKPLMYDPDLLNTAKLSNIDLGRPGENTYTQRLILRILRIFYQGLRLITGGLKTEIAELEAEIKKADEQPADSAKTVSDKAG
jgi:hypothetical protein